jgi:predicted TIM-barrel enzyme
MLIVLLVIVSVIAVLEGALLFRASKRLLQFDDVFQMILPVLEDYAADLKKMSSGNLDGVLVDNPEVLAFHKTNQAHKVAIESIVDSVTKMNPPRAKTPRLPKPEWE